MLKCFVTFCGEDKGDIHVELLIDELKARTQNAVDFLVYYKMRYGESLTKFMRDDLSESETVLALFGPKYKERYDNTLEHTGAYQELDMIIARMENRGQYLKPRVIPIIWQGADITASFPGHFQTSNPLTCDLSDFRAHGTTHGDPFIPETTLRKFSKELDKISDILLEESLRHSESYQKKRAEYFAHLLQPTIPEDQIEKLDVKEILQFKYEHGRYDAQTFEKLFFTNTRFFNSLKTKRAGLVCGRKGAGKTTLVQIREAEASAEDFYPPINIAVDGWSIHYLFQHTTFKQVESDFEYLELEIKFFDYVWITFLFLCICESLTRECGRETPSKVLLSDKIRREFEKTITVTNPKDTVYYQSLFQLAISGARGFIQSVVDKADSKSEDHFRLDVLRNMSVKNLLYSIFGQGLEGIRNQAQASGCKKFLFCFDRFDTELQRYRDDKTEYNPALREERGQRELDWLSSLVLLVRKIDKPDRLSSEFEIFDFLSCVNFLVVLPYDRALEIHGSQRDSIANEPIQELSWQPKELMTMLRRRIQAIYDISDEMLEKKTNRTPQARLERCFSLACKDLPDKLYVALNHQIVEMDFFLYILRHTFFRPRDLLIHYAPIITHCDMMTKRRLPIEVDTLREIVSRHNRTIVDFEFVNELEGSWTNIEKVLALFKGRQQVWENRKLKQLIGPVKFDFHQSTNSIMRYEKKLEFLYNIGFLGLKNKKSYGAKADQQDFVFSFMGADRRDSFDSDEILSNLLFGIHPIFVESLHLKVDPDHPVMMLSWEMLNRFDRGHASEG